MNDGLCGLLRVDKPVGPTSHDAVARVRRQLSVKAVGHAGTLDPFASGLLVMLIGEATRLQDFIMHRDKTYSGRVVFGSETDSGDPTGAVTETLPPERWPAHDPATLENLIRTKFTGTVTQVPPAHSAIKIDGVRAYAMARKGQTVDMPSRTVTIHEWRVTGWDGTGFHFVMTCSSGTYVRSAARDLGRALGLPTHLGALRRLGIGPTLVEGAPLPEQVGPVHLEPIEDHLPLTPGLDAEPPLLALLAKGRQDLLPSTFHPEGFHPVRQGGNLVQIYAGTGKGCRLVFNRLKG